MPVAELRGSVVTVETKWTEAELIKQVPGSRWDPGDRLWTVPLSWPVCLQLRGLFGDNLTVGPDLAKWSWNTFTQRVEPALKLRELTHPTDDSPVEVTEGSQQLYPFQIVGSQFLGVVSNGLIGDALGLGKTVTTLGGLALLGVAEALPALVICPNSTKTAWANQTRRWFPEATPYTVTGSALKRKKILDAAAVDPTAIVIINLEAVRLVSRLSGFGSTALKRCRTCSRHGEEGLTPARCEVHPKILNELPFKTVILDEAHKIKSPDSKVTRACWAVGHGPTVRRRWALTGTPIANHVGDLWSIMHFIDPVEYPVKTKFVDRYGLQAWNAHGGLDVVGLNPVNRDEFYRVFEPRYRRTLKELVFDQLPTVVRSTRWVEMIPKQERAYRDLEKKLITYLTDGTVLIAPNNLTKATRLLQLASSYATVEEVELKLTVEAKCKCYARGLDNHAPGCALGTKIIVTLVEPSSKLDALEDAFEELGDKPLVVAAESRQLIDLAAKRFAKRGVTHGLITGPVSEFERERTIQQFGDGNIQVVLMTIKAGGTGVDGLQVADTMFVLQRSWSMIDNVQLEGRVNRIGSERHESIHIVDFVAHDTVEETALFPRLMTKFERLEEINRDRARLARAGVSHAEVLFNMRDEESRIMASNLGEPETTYEEHVL